MPYKDWRKWRVFYEMEPFGWWHDEEVVARILSMLFNMNVKPENAKSPKDFMRLDYHKSLIEALEKKPEKPIDFSKLTAEDIYALKQRIRAEFGAM